VIDPWVGLTSYYKTLYFWVSSGVVIGLIFLWLKYWDRFEIWDEWRRFRR